MDWHFSKQTERGSITADPREEGDSDVRELAQDPLCSNCTAQATLIRAQFPRQIGLLHASRMVSVAQKVVRHAPQATLTELLVAALVGCARPRTPQPQPDSQGSGRG
jgi:hypothetical protein